VIIPALPFFFAPIYKETIWGGNAFVSRFNRPISPGRSRGESWEIASHVSDQSVVSAGPLAGTKLNQLVAEAVPPETLLGKNGTFGNFPLLFKFIDANDRLSVQVHPDDLQARANGWGEFGKTECWYILDAKENARIIVGFNKNVTRAEISRAIENNSLQECLNFIPIKKGDLLHIPAGTVHAIMEGTLLYEIQETSDATLRLYDWGRVDAAGKPRPLHVRDALTVLDMSGHHDYHITPVTIEEHGYRHSYRIVNRYFALEQYTFQREREIILPARQSFRVLSAAGGNIGLYCPSGIFEIPFGSTVLLPAVLHEVRAAGGPGAELLVTTIPDLQGEIIGPLRDAGISDELIGALGGVPRHNDLLRFLQV
jgi:mannose-6-phosphate isomerase